MRNWSERWPEQEVALDRSSDMKVLIDWTVEPAWPGTRSPLMREAGSDADGLGEEEAKLSWEPWLIATMAAASCALMASISTCMDSRVAIEKEVRRGEEGEEG